MTQVNRKKLKIVVEFGYDSLDENYHVKTVQSDIQKAYDEIPKRTLTVVRWIENIVKLLKNINKICRKLLKNIKKYDII